MTTADIVRLYVDALQPVSTSKSFDGVRTQAFVVHGLSLTEVIE